MVGSSWIQKIAYVANFPGARIAKDRVAVTIEDVEQAIDISPPEQTTDFADRDGRQLPAETSDSTDLSAHGASSLTGRIEREDSPAQVSLEWTTDTGDVLFSETLFTLSPGEERDIDVSHIVSPYVSIEVEDTGEEDGEYTLSVVMG